MPHIHELKDFTTSAFVLHPTEPKLLLLKHRKIGKWLQPGGHVELHENPLQALEHELEEETGLLSTDWVFIDQPDQPNVRHETNNEMTLPLPFHFNVHNFNETHQHIDICYLVKATTDNLTENPDGADEIRWLSMDEIKVLHKQGGVFSATKDICEWIAARYF